MKSCILAVALALSLPLSLSALEVNSNEWGKEFEKAMVGARDDVAYAIYKKAGTTGRIWLEFTNRKTRDVKVSFKVVGKGMERGTPIPLTGFIKAGGYWPNGYEKSVKCDFPEPVIEIENVVTGVVEEEQIIETDSDGKQIEKYKYKFTSDADLAKQRKKDDK
jgi:hypothetical protein